MPNKMDFEQFERFMTEYLALLDDEEAASAALKKLDPDFNYLGFGRHSQLILEALKAAMGDKYDYISYWLYDLDRGKKWHKGSVTEKDGSDIPLKTLRQLFDHIITQ